MSVRVALTLPPSISKAVCHLGPGGVPGIAGVAINVVRRTRRRGIRCNGPPTVDREHRVTGPAAGIRSIVVIPRRRVVIITADVVVIARCIIVVAGRIIVVTGRIIVVAGRIIVVPQIDRLTLAQAAPRIWTSRISCGRSRS